MRRVLVDEHDPGRASRRGCRCRAAAPARRAERRLRSVPAASAALRRRPAAGSRCALSASAQRLAAGRRQAEAQSAARSRPRSPAPGRNAASAASPTVVEARCPAAARAWRKAPTIRPRTSAGVAEPHLGLGRMDVDVDLVRPARRETARPSGGGRAPAHPVGAAHRADQQFVAHRPAVDDEVLVARQGAVQGRQADQPGEPKTAALGVDRHRILGEFAAQQRRRAGPAPARARRSGEPQQDALFVAGHREGDLRIGHRQPPHRIDRLVALGARRSSGI